MGADDRADRVPAVVRHGGGEGLVPPARHPGRHRDVGADDRAVRPGALVVPAGHLALAGLCTAASTSLRNHVSYAFVLSGYTVAIIGLPAVDQPLLVSSRRWRVVPRSAWGSSAPRRSVRSSGRSGSSRTSTSRPTPPGCWACRPRADRPRQRQPQGLLNALSKIVEVDAQRDHAWFEGERGRRRAGAWRCSRATCSACCAPRAAWPGNGRG